MSLSRGRFLGRSVSAAAAALVAASGTVLLAPPVPSEAAAGAHPHVTLVSQSPWVAPAQPDGPATFTLLLAPTDAPPGARVSVTLYSRLQSRSAFELTLRASPSQANLARVDRTAPVPLSRLRSQPSGDAALQVTVVPSISSKAPPSPSLDLSCTFAAHLCTGVYPAVVTLESASGGELDRFTTFLTYAAHGTAKLRFAWVVPLSARSSIRAGATDPANALTPLSAGTATRLEHLVADLRTNPVPVTVEPAPQTVQALSSSGAAGQAAVRALGALSGDTSSDETLAEGYVPVDLGALAGAGLPTEIAAQVAAGAAALRQHGVRAGSGSTWVLSGRVGASTGAGLEQVHATRVVVPDDQLAPATTRFTWASTFQLSFGGKGSPVLAAASDRELSSQFKVVRDDPALAATRLLADLAMVHFEDPSTTHRGLVAVPPSGWRPTRTFDTTLLEGLQGNPVVEPVTLTRFFATVSPDRHQPTRHLASSGSGPALAGSVARMVSTARLRLTAFDGAVTAPHPPPVLTELGQALLVGEASYRDPNAVAKEVRAFDQLLGHQVSLVKLSTDQSITLTARTGVIPITILSGASYTIKGTLTLSSAKFKFPEGRSRSLPLRHPTNSVRVRVVARTLGDSPVTVEFTAPGGGLVFARGQLVVRSTATSVVGIVLTAAALAILLGWWARTWRKGRRRRRAAAAGADHVT